MFIAHRINSIEELLKVPENIGIEVDIRDFDDWLSLSHDPFIIGENFDYFMAFYNHAFIILNIKSERIEYRVLEVLKKYNIENYFFLDSSFPMMYKLSSEGESNIAIRYSEYESIESVLLMKGKINWVWVDCFTEFPLTKDIYNTLKSNGFKICVVSPELQNQADKLETYIDIIIKQDMIPDMVCSKIYNYNIWQKIYS